MGLTLDDTPEDTFFELLDLNPHREEKLEEDEFLTELAKDPSMASKMYTFDAFEDVPLYPLHMICALGASTDCVKACYKAHPAAMELCTDTMGFPVHFATAFDAAVDVVHYLAKKDAAALEHQNAADGKTPLHLAAASEFGSPDVVIFLTERCPKACELKDGQGNTPLNLLCRMEEPVLAKIEDLTEGECVVGLVSFIRLLCFCWELRCFAHSLFNTTLLLLTYKYNSLPGRWHGPRQRRNLAAVERPRGPSRRGRAQRFDCQFAAVRRADWVQWTNHLASRH